MLGLALAIALTGASTEARPPANAMVAFNDGCDWPLQSLDSLPDDWDRSGWKAVAPKRGSPIARYLSAAQAEAPTGFRAQTFVRKVQKRTAYLVLTESSEASGRTRISCRLLDFDAPDDLSLARIVPWAGRQPDGDIGGHGQPSRGHFWQPGLTEGHERTEIYYVPSASPLGKTEHFRGLVIGASRTSGGFAPPAGAAVPALGRAMLDVFKSACARTGNDLEAMKSDAVGSGWTPMGDDGDPRIGRLVEMGRKAVEADGKSAGANFRRAMGGRETFLIVSRYEDKSGFWGTGCRLYDFGATEPLDPKLLNEWMGKPPTAVQEPAPGLTKRLWEPGWRDGITLEINHVPQNHPVGKTYGLSGNILVAQAIGGF